MALPFFVIGMKTEIFSPVATAEFSKFAGTLSAALTIKKKKKYIYIYNKKVCNMI